MSVQLPGQLLGGWRVRAFRAASQDMGEFGGGRVCVVVMALGRVSELKPFLHRATWCGM